MIKNVALLPAGLPKDVLHMTVNVKYCLHHHIILNHIQHSVNSVAVFIFLHIYTED